MSPMRSTATFPCINEQPSRLACQLLELRQRHLLQGRNNRRHPFVAPRIGVLGVHRLLCMHQPCLHVLEAVGFLADVLDDPDADVSTLAEERLGQRARIAGVQCCQTKAYKRAGQLPLGTYYLVLRDTSLGVLSSSASDISVKVRLQPQ